MENEQCAEFRMESLESFEPLVNPIRQYRNRSKRTLKTGEEKLAEVLAKIASLQKSTEKTAGIDRTKVRTYNVKLRLRKSLLYRCFDCGSCFSNPDFLELHEKSHAEQGKCDIDLRQEPVDAEMNLKQNAWFVGDFGEDDEADDDGEHILQLDCTVEEGEDIFDITFDRTKCEKTYTMKYKVKKEPVGKCEYCKKQFYNVDWWKQHELEHEKFFDIANIEPSINIIRSPRIEESTMTLDDYFYEALDVSDILERSSGTIDYAPDGRLGAGAGITLEYHIVPRRLLSVEKDSVQVKDPAVKPKSEGTNVEDNGPPKVNQSECQLMVKVKEEAIKEEPTDEPVMISQQIKPEPVEENRMEVVNGAATHKRLQANYPCLLCTKQFRFRAALLVHERTHSGNRPYRCNVCSDTFISRGKLFLHSYAQHRNRSKEVTCDQCNRHFLRPKLLQYHLAICRSVGKSSR